MVLTLVGCVVVLSVALLGAAQLVGMRAHAVTAADAAALAAAPVTFRSFGATGSATSEAMRFASLHGARMVECRCSHDESYRTRVVTVVVEVEAEIFGFGFRSVQATSHAEFDPLAVLMSS